MAKTRTKVEQGAILQQLNVKDVGGVCLTVCKLWVQACLDKKWKASDTCYDVFTNGKMTVNLQEQKKELKEVVKTQKKHGKYKDLKIIGVNNKTTAVRVRKCLKFAGLRTRRDVIRYLYRNPGVYIYAILGKGDNESGHVIAFDTRNKEKIIVFDPNQAEWVLTKETYKSIEKWWSGLWEGIDVSDSGKLNGVNYKKAFHRSDREIIHYFK